MATHAIVTIEQVEANRTALKADLNRMDANMANCEYDLNDCYVSHKLKEAEIDVCDYQLDILKNGGVRPFVGYTDLDGNFLTMSSFTNQFGGVTFVFYNEAKDEKIFTSAKTAKGLLKKGVKKVDYLAPAWSKTRTGNTIGEIWAAVYEAKYNRLTGEEQPREIIGDHVDA